MKQEGLVSKYTVAQYKLHIASCNNDKIENKVDRKFDNQEHLQVVVSDLTYVRVSSTWHYICVLIDLFNRDLHDEINRAYSYGLFSVIPFLVRKLFENLVIDIFKKKYGTSDIHKYYDVSNHRCHNFLELLETLKSNITDFSHIENNFNLEFVNSVNKYREVGNSSAHSISLKFLKRDIDELSEDAEEIEHIVKLFVRVLNLIS